MKISAAKMSASQMFCTILCIALFITTRFRDVATEDDISEPFDVKPGGEEHQYYQEAFGLKFRFTYIAQGGTNEEWTAKIESEDGGNRVMFAVGRPSGVSYLFFEHFRLEVEGAKVVVADAMSQSSNSLPASEYKVGSTYIENVPGQFQAHLATAYIVTVKDKGDL